MRLPIVTIVMYEGRTIEQKRRLVKAVTDAIVQSLAPAVTPEHVDIVINEIKKENRAGGGILRSDEKESKSNP